VSAGAPDSRKNLHKIQSPIIIDMLNWIIEQQGLPVAPPSREMNGEQEG
jgi:hypothetical protein